MTAPYTPDTQTAVFKQPGLIPLSELAEILPTLNRISSWIERIGVSKPAVCMRLGAAIESMKKIYS